MMLIFYSLINRYLHFRVADVMMVIKRFKNLCFTLFSKLLDFSFTSFVCMNLGKGQCNSLVLNLRKSVGKPVNLLIH